MSNARPSLVTLGMLVCSTKLVLAQPPPASNDPMPAQPPPVQPAEPPPQEPRVEPTPIAAPAEKPVPEEPSSTFEIYGFAMFDGGYDFGKVGDPAWFDTLRPTKLPSFEDQYGQGGRTFMGVRQTRFGVKSTTPTDHGEVKSTFEFEMFGVGADEGQTTIRLRHAYGDWGQFRAGQTWSPFMDIDVFPNTIEYWGPNGMAFFRNVQVAWMPIQGDSRVTVALERPGATADRGDYTERVELDDIVPRFPVPDLSAEGRLGGGWGYVELSGILRYIKWDDLNRGAPALDGSEIAWGVHVSSNIKAGPALFRLSALYGEGIQNYMNDAVADIGPEPTGDPAAPLDGVVLPVLGLVAFADLEWSELFTSSLGWSMVWNDNSEGQSPDAFHIGHYAIGNLLVHPTKNLMFGAELQYGRRENNSDGYTADDFRIQFSARYKFSTTIGGK